MFTKLERLSLVEPATDGITSLMFSNMNSSQIFPNKLAALFCVKFVNACYRKLHFFLGVENLKNHNILY